MAHFQAPNGTEKRISLVTDNEGSVYIDLDMLPGGWFNVYGGKYKVWFTYTDEPERDPIMIEIDDDARDCLWLHASDVEVLT